MQIIVMFLIKPSLRKAIRTKCGNKWGYCYLLLENKTVKRSVQCHVFVQSRPRRRPSDK